MPWLKKAAEAPKNEKVWELSDFLYRMYDSSLHYCAEKLTDGHIPASRVTTLTPKPATKQQIEALVTRRLWHRLPALTCRSCIGLREQHGAGELPRSGYLVHDYLEFNPSRVEWERRQEGLRRGGKKGAAVRYGSGHSSSDSSGYSSGQDPLSVDSHSSTYGSKLPADLWPVPRTPYPVPQSDSSTGGAGGSEADDPPIPDAPAEAAKPRPKSPLGTARKGSQGRGGLRHIADVMGGARG